jgi:parvulin-like peptidyl-prolyl isomerase
MKHTATRAATAFLAAALALAFAVGCGKKKAEQTLTPGAIDSSQVVIWVDDAGITHGEVMAEVARMSRGLPPNLDEEQLNKARLRILSKAIDDLVLRQLIRGEYGRSGVAIPQDDVDAARNSMFRSPEDLATRLADSHMTVQQLDDNLRLDIFRNLMVKDALAEEVAKLDENSAKEYYDANIQMFTKPAGRMASHIFIRVPEGADDEAREAARAKAETARRAAAEGADFASLAVEVSDAPDRVMGGQFGIVTPGRLIPELQGAVDSQEVGVVGPVVETKDGYHVILVTSIEEEEVLPFETVKEQILRQLRLQIQHRLGSEFVAKLRDKATIKFDGVFSSLNGDATPEGAAEGEGVAEEAAPEEIPAE